MTQRAVVTDPIRMYTILATPGDPWNLDDDAAHDDTQMPWRTVLDTITRQTYPTTGSVLWGGGATTVEQVAARITTALNEGGRFRYEEYSGAASRYVEDYPWPLGSPSPTEIHQYFDLTAYHNQITGAGDAAFANCLDMAWGVAILSNLLGDSLSVMVLRRSPDPVDGFTTNPICPVGSNPAELGSWERMAWGYHAVAWRGTSTAGTVYDACLRFDNDPDPAVIIDILPVAMTYSEYCTRLTSDALSLTPHTTLDPLV